MPFVEISPQELAHMADEIEDEAYTLPPGSKRTDMLLQVYGMRTAVNRAEWDQDFLIKAEVSTSRVGKQNLMKAARMG